MKTKHLRNGITKMKLNSDNTRVKKHSNNKMLKGSARTGNAFKFIAPNKFKKSAQLSNGFDDSPSSIGVQRDDPKSTPVGAAKSPRTAASRKNKRSLSTASVKKPSAKKFKGENGDVEKISSNDKLKSKNNEPCDGNLSTISVQSGSESTANSLKTSLILDNDDKKSDICSGEIQQQTFLSRSSAEKTKKLVNLHNLTEAGMLSTAETVPLDFPVSQSESDAGNIDQSQGDCTMPHPGTFRPRGYGNILPVFSRSIRKGSAYTSFTGYCTVGTARKKLLVSMRPVNRLIIEGCYCIKPVLGKVRILGYTVHEGEKRAVFSPRHRALIPVTCKHEDGSVVERSSEGGKGRSSQHQEEEGRSSQHQEEGGRSSQHQEGRSSQHQGEEGRSSQHQEEGGREAGVNQREDGGPRPPSRHPSEGVSGGLGVVLTEEMVESLRSTRGLDDSALASLHLEIGVPFIVVELSSYRSRLPEVLRHIAVPSLVMDQHPGRLTCASLLPGTESSAPTNLNAKGPQSAVHYVVGTCQDGQNFSSSSTDKCGPMIVAEVPSTSEANGFSGLALPTPPLIEPSCDHANILREKSNYREKGIMEPNPEKKLDEACQPGEEVPHSTAGVGRPSNSCDVNEWYSVLGGAKPRIHAMGQAPFVAVPWSWWQAVREFKKEENEVEISGFRLYPKRRVVIIGDKGTGKSTFLKYFINSLLDRFDQPKASPSTVDVQSNPKRSSNVAPDVLGKSEGPSRAVCCLDLDPGQPEQSLPGSLSVCRYTKPLLGPAFTYSLACVKTSKELWEKKKIFERRRKMVQQLLSLQRETDGTEGRSSKFADLTELLEDADTLENQTPPGELTKQLLLGDVSPALKPHLYIDLVRELMKTVRSEHSDEPLVVNTMGWLSELGLTLLLDILNIVGPTHVIHLTSDFNLELDCHYMSHLFKEKLHGTVSTVNPILNYDYFQIMAPTSTTKAVKYNRKPPGPRDLRSLMFTSYFTALWSEDSTNTLDVTTCKIGVRLKYTDLAVYDLRFSDNPLAVLENMRQNRALVALCSTEETNIFSAGKGLPKRVEFRPPGKLPLNSFFGDHIEDQAAGLDSRQMLIRQNSEAHSLFKYFQQQTNDKSKLMNGDGKVSQALSNRIRELGRTNKLAFEVHGWAIVMTVNTTTKEVRILTPTPDTALPKTNTLVRCSVDLPQGFEKLLFES